MPAAVPTANGTRFWPLIALGILTLAGAALRLWQTRESLWLDELHTAWCAAGHLGDVASRAAIGNQSPVFFWLEWLMLRLLGRNELAVRLVSVVAGSLLPLALYWLCRSWKQGPGVGLLAAALVAFDPLSIFFATEARPYALVQLLAVVHLGITAELFVRPSVKLRVAFVIGAVLLFYLHYTAALVVVAEVCSWILLSILQPASIHYRRAQLLIDIAVIGPLLLPARDHVYRIFARRANWASFVPAIDLANFWEVLGLLPWSISALVLATILVVGAFVRRFRPQQPDNLDPARQTAYLRLLVLCFFAVPASLAAIATARGIAPLYFPRYLAGSAPAALLLTALCVGAMPWRWPRYVSAALVLAVAVWTSGIVQQLSTDGRVIADRNEDWRGAIAWLNSQLTDQHIPILVASGLIEADALKAPHGRLLEDYCLLPVTSLYPVAMDRSDLVPLPNEGGSSLAPDYKQAVQDRGQAWVIIRGSFFNETSTPYRFARRYGGRSAKTLASKSFGNVHVIHIAVH